MMVVIASEETGTLVIDRRSRRMRSLKLSGISKKSPVEGVVIALTPRLPESVRPMGGAKSCVLGDHRTRCSEITLG
jgi:hypothetical protein